MQTWLDKFPFIIGFLFVAFIWITVSYFISFMCGWRLLALHYRSKGKFDGPRWWFQWGKLRAFAFKSSLIVGANQKGLYLAVVFPFNFGFPRLFIPWEETSVPRGTGLFMPSLGFQLGKGPSIAFSVSADLADRIIRAASQAPTVREQV